MRVHGGASSAAVRGPKVRLRGLSEIATNPPRLILAEQLFDSADVQHGVFQVHLLPAQVHQLGGPQTVPEGQQDHDPKSGRRLSGLGSPLCAKSVHHVAYSMTASVSPWDRLLGSVN